MDPVIAFWIAVAAVLIAGGWFKSRNDAEKHATLRTIIEKNGTVDDAQLRALFGPVAVQSRPGDFYAFLRVIGTIVMSTRGGSAALFHDLSPSGQRAGWNHRRSRRR